MGSVGATAGWGGKGRDRTRVKSRSTNRGFAQQRRNQRVVYSSKFGRPHMNSQGLGAPGKRQRSRSGDAVLMPNADPGRARSPGRAGSSQAPSLLNPPFEKEAQAMGLSRVRPTSET